MKKKTTFLFPFALTLIAVVVCLHFIEYNELVEVISKTNGLFITVLISSYAATYVLRCIRIQFLYPSKNLPWLGLWKSVAISSFLNLLIPAKLGELALPYYIKKLCKINLDEAIGIWIVVRIMDAICLFFAFDVLLSIYCIINPSSGGATYLLLLFNAIVALLIVLVYLAILLAKRGSLQASILDSLYRFKKVRLLTDHISKVTAQIKSLPPAVILKSAEITGCIFSIQLIVYWSGIMATNLVDMSFITASLGAYGAIVTQFLPINTFAGIGSMQAGWVGSLTSLGFSADLAFSLSIFFHIYLLSSSGILALSGWCIRVLPTKANNDSR